jgi:HPt (histidine-containing phosphotransfer) domain-containing protein
MVSRTMLASIPVAPWCRMECLILPVPAVDLTRLARQTQGDAALEREVLRLFADRIDGDFDRLCAAPAAGRREIAHLIVGSASAIGAEDVVRLAREIERGGGQTAAQMAALGAAIDAAQKFIASYLAA